MGQTAVVKEQIVSVDAKSLLANNTAVAAACQAVSWATASTGDVLTVQSNGTVAFAAVSAGITSLNGLTGATQTFAVATTGTDFTISSSGTAHTFAIPSASATARGLVTTGSQSFAGVKLFRDSIGVANISGSNGVSNQLITLTAGSVVTAQLIEQGASSSWGFFVGGSANTIGVNRSSFEGVWTTDAANRWASRRGANAQAVGVYNTYTSDTSYERLSVEWASNICTITTQKGSAGGTLRGLKIGDAATALLGFYGVTPVDQPATVTDPTGGGTIDAEARTAIEAIIDRLQELGLIA